MGAAAALDEVPIHVPGVGGNVLMFGRLSQLLGPDQPFYGLQARGLDGKKKPFTDVSEMAAHYIEEIRSVRPAGPYLIGGTCTGGVVAHEMAQQLSARGERVVLAIMESWHPRSHQAHRGRLQFFLWPAQFALGRLMSYCREVWSLPISEWPQYWQDKLGKLKGFLGRGVPPDGAEEIAANERVAAATYFAVSRYEPRPYAGRLLNIIASGRPLASSTEDTRMRWSELALMGGRSVAIPAENSGQLFVPPHVQDLAQHLASYFSRECPNTPTSPRGLIREMQMVTGKGSRTPAVSGKVAE